MTEKKTLLRKRVSFMVGNGTFANKSERKEDFAGFGECKRGKKG
jgi:hypothetical protein